MKVHRLIAAAAIATCAAGSALADPGGAIIYGEAGYAPRQESNLPGKTRAEVAAERAQVQGRATVGNRYSHLATPYRGGTVDYNQIRRGAVEATRLPMGEN